MTHRPSTRTLLALGTLTLGASLFARSAAADDPRGGIVPAPRTGVLAVGPGAGVPGLVVVYARPSGSEKLRFLPYGPAFKGGVRVAVGDVNGDGTPDIVTAPGNGPPAVKVFDGTTAAELATFFAYEPKFKGGVFVAAGDVNGDGKAEIITGAGAGSGGGPHVKVLDGTNGNTLKSFFAFDAGFKGGVRVAAADFHGDGTADIVTGAGKGKEGPHVKVFDGSTLQVLADFFPFDPKAKNGVFVAAGDVDGDEVPDVVTGPDKDGDPHVRAFKFTGVPFASFFAYDRAFRGGVRVAVGDVDGGGGSGEIVTGVGKGVGPNVRVFDARTNGAAPSTDVLPFDPAFTGGVFVAAGN